MVNWTGFPGVARGSQCRVEKALEVLEKTTPAQGILDYSRSQVSGGNTCSWRCYTRACLVFKINCPAATCSCPGSRRVWGAGAGEALP